MQGKSSVVALVGLDIGKNVHVLGSYRADSLEALHEPFSLYNSRAGFECLASHLDSLLKTYPVVELGNEPTIYYEAIGQRIRRTLRQSWPVGAWSTTWSIPTW
jgi:hypothetical protein